jgi:hypothetical protein
MAVKRCFFQRIRAYYNISCDDAFLTNGDDGLILVPVRFIEEYKDFMSELWNLNEQKTMIDESPSPMFSFNSRYFYVKEGRVVECDIIRWNLIQGLDKYGGTMTDPRVWNTITESCDEKYHVALWEQFHKHWKKRLDCLTTKGGNYFHPLASGGLGLIAGVIPYTTTPLQWSSLHYVEATLGNSNLRKPRMTKVVSRSSKKGKLKGVPKTSNKVDYIGRWGGSVLSKNLSETITPSIGMHKNFDQESKLYTYKLNYLEGRFSPFDFDHLFNYRWGPLQYVVAPLEIGAIKGSQVLTFEFGTI